MNASPSFPVHSAFSSTVYAAKAKFGADKAMTQDEIKSFLFNAEAATVSRINQIRHILDATFPDLPGYERPLIKYEGVPAVCLVCIFHKTEDIIIPRLRRIAGVGQPICLLDNLFLSHLALIGEAVLENLDEIRKGWVAAGVGNTGGPWPDTADENGLVQVQTKMDYPDGKDYSMAAAKLVFDELGPLNAVELLHFQSEGSEARRKVEDKAAQSEIAKHALASLFGVDPDMFVDGKKSTHEQPARRQ